MSRLLAYMANDPQRLRCALHPGRALLVSHGSERRRAEATGDREFPADRADRIDGWGVGFYQGGEVLLQRRPKSPAGALDFFDLVKELRTDALIGHLRHATVGGQKNENTPPFRFRSWLFAHHGTVAGFDEKRGELMARVPDFLWRNIRGQTDSEHLFHVFLANLHAAGKLDEALITTRDAAAALAATIEQCDRATGDGASTLDLAVTNGRILLVTRRGLPVFYYRLSGVRDCPVCRELPPALGSPRTTDHEHLRAVVVVANGAGDRPGAPWQELPEGQALAVSHELHVEVIPLA